ncbi:DNA gyrase subunit A, partial [Candidatus Bathyarchaeota archaeon]|nr:DNA gyrase subunit A [Candidatus Bathyarchaeota archaeon]
MTDDSILKPLDITEPTESTDSTESTEPTAETAPTDSNRNNSALETYDSPYGRIAPVTITSEMKRSYLDYAMSVIVSRALPDVRDGLKPVHRRILFAMKELGITHKGKHKKSARIVGEVLGKYHPHGDTAVYDAMVRLAQEFSMRYPLVDGQGNFGSVDGDSPAAMRYTEARLDKITQELLVDLDRDTVDWVDNFDGSYKEPTVLPAALPNLLLMGSDGIAVGMATKIPPHHLTEVVNAINALAGKSTTKRDKTEFDENTLENENPSDLTGDLESSATIDDLLEHIQGPDFPTGGTIYDQEAVQEVYRTGKGRVVTRAEAVIEETKSGKFQIIVTELPYQVNKANLVAKIANLVRDKKLTGISDLRDESDREGMRIVIVMKKSARPKSVLNNLFKQTALQSTFSANVVALDDQGRPHLMNLKTILMHYLKHRQIVVVRRSQHDLKSARARIHILEGYLKALDHLDEVIETIKKSKNSDEAKTNLIKKFEFSEIQAVAILDMQLRKLSALERQKIQDEYDALMSKIKGLTGLLLDPQAIIALILKELKEIEKLYHDERRTRVVKGKLGQFSEEDLIAKVDNLVTITKGGYIKLMPLGTYRSQRRGGKGVVGMTTKEEDEILKMAVANTHDYALFFTDTGKVFMNRVFELPEGSRTAKGQAIINHLGISQDEKIEALLTVSKEVLESKDFFITMATRKGQVKKTSIKEYANIRVSGK